MYNVLLFKALDNIIYRYKSKALYANFTYHTIIVTNRLNVTI